MNPIRVAAVLLLGAAFMAGCNDRSNPTAPSARPLTATAADHSSYTWTLQCSGDAASDASWVWAAAGVALGSGQGTCYPSSSPIGGSGARPATADSLRACIYQFSQFATCQSWTFAPASAFKAQLKASSTISVFWPCFSRHCPPGQHKLTASATLDIES
jgi:hypothetical protein